METWGAVLASFGGQALLIAALVWFGKRFFDHFLEKTKLEHLETIKEQNMISIEMIKQNNNVSTEALKTTLGLIGGKKKYIFEKVYDKQMEILEKAYKDIHKAIVKLDIFISPFGEINQERIDKGLEAYEAFVDTYDYCIANRIWLKIETADKTCELLNHISKNIFGFRLLFVEKGQLMYRDEKEEKKYRISKTSEWVKIIDQVKLDVKEPLRLLEDDFRQILGVVESEI